MARHKVSFNCVNLRLGCWVFGVVDLMLLMMYICNNAGAARNAVFS